MNEQHLPACADCPFKKSDRVCIRPDGRHPANCPTASMPELAAESLATLRNAPELLRFAKESALVEADGYSHKDTTPRPARPRIVEIIDFAKRMGYKRLGLIFCMGLRGEAQATLKILEANGFEMVSVVCKAGGIPKSAIGIEPEGQIDCTGPETMCNPIMQAEVCNAMEVEFSILLGLCVGHDSLALQHLKSPATVFAVKDRLLGNNPLAALYTLDTYYRYLTEPFAE